MGRSKIVYTLSIYIPYPNIVTKISGSIDICIYNNVNKLDKVLLDKLAKTCYNSSRFTNSMQLKILAILLLLIITIYKETNPMEYREFTIKEASDYLETDKANVYKLIKDNILTPIANEPMKLTEFQLLAYLNTKIPTHLKVYPRELEVA